MIKRVFGKKLSRERSSREALFVSLIGSLFTNSKIKTTKAKAKSIVGQVDHLILLAKKNNLSSKRQIVKFFRGDKKISTHLWTKVVSNLSARNSGFTRMTALPQRKGDMAEMVRLELVEDLKPKQDENVSTKTKGN